MFRALAGQTPKKLLPEGAVDCHMHFFDSSKYQAQPGGPDAPEDALISHYDQVRKWIGIDRLVVTQGNSYQRDNRCTLEVLEHYGDKARAIVAVDGSITDAQLQWMTDLGVRGTRIMNIMQGAVGLDELLHVNRRVSNFDWSMIVQFDGREMLEHSPLLQKIQGNYVIDHIGKFLEPVNEQSKEFSSLLRLIDRGNCYVKIAACYETSALGYPNYADVGCLAKYLIAYAPDRVIWGSNWPHLMSKTAETYPNDAHLLDLVNEWAGTEENRYKLFVENPATLYGFASN